MRWVIIMNKKKIFNFKQYVQGLLKFKLPGIIGTLLVLICSIFNPVSDVMSVKNYMASGYYGWMPELITYISYNKYMIFIIIIYTPIIAFMSWKFLNKRNSSDFYHALPYTRRCTYLTTVAAAVTWIIIPLLINAVVSMFIYNIFSEYFIINASSVFTGVMAIFVASLLCYASITIACAVTGNTLSNLCVSGLIIFLPRFVTFLTAYTLRDAFPFLDMNRIMPVFDTRYNVLVGTILSSLGIYNFTDIYSNVPSIIYTLVVSIIYLIIGGVAFSIRKSETAGYGASGKTIGFVIRMAIGYTIGVVGVTNYVRDMNYGSVQNNVAKFIVTLLVATLVVMIYQSIIDKSLKGFLKSITSVIAVYVLSFITLLIMNGAIGNFKESRLNADNISYVTISQLQRNYMDDGEDYYSRCLENMKITDKQVIDIICDAYNKNVDRYVNNGNGYYYGNGYVIGIKQNGHVTYRRVYFNNGYTNTYEKITDILCSKDEYKEKLKSLPDAKDVSIHVNSSDKAFTREEYINIYNTFKEELNETDVKTWYQEVMEYNNYNILNVKFFYDGVVVSAQLPLNIMPKTMKALYNGLNEKSYASESIAEVSSALNTIGTKNDKNISQIEISKYDYNERKWIYYRSDALKDEATGTEEIGNIEEILLSKESLDKLKRQVSDKEMLQDIDRNKTLIRIVYTRYENNDVYNGVQLEDFYLYYQQ